MKQDPDRRQRMALLARLDRATLLLAINLFLAALCYVAGAAGLIGAVLERNGLALLVASALVGIAILLFQPLLKADG